MSKLVLLGLLLTSLIVATHATADHSKHNARIGKKFLDENAAKEGVITTASGLQYKILTQGTGTVKPVKSDTVKVHYRGTLISGKEFDSSYSRGEPASFGVGQVIAGWTEALQLMVEGDVFELYIPSELAYGTRGAGKDIGPNSTLIFKVELIGIEGKSGSGKKKSKKDL